MNRVNECKQTFISHKFPLRELDDYRWWSTKYEKGPEVTSNPGDAANWISMNRRNI